MNIYYNWGFEKNPFETKPLPPNENGESLLIDRDKEGKKLRLRLSSSSNIVTVEGDNGIGKTSLINVASYGLYKEFLETGIGDLFIPCNSLFQLDPEKKAEDLVDEVLMAVAQTLLSKGHDLLECGYKLEGANGINKWLNYPFVKSYNGSFNIPLFGAGAGVANSVNTSMGFYRSGFKLKILDWLREIFPRGTNGGVVCVIDNLELLQTSAIAKRQLEKLRDTLFAYTGLRWVLCGSLGIVKGIASSPRFKGRFSDPIIVDGIPPKFAPNILLSRINSFKKENTDSYLPLGSKEFVHLYQLLHSNIRNVLNYADNYCLSIADDDLHPNSEQEKRDAYHKWLNQQSVSKVNAIKSQIKPRAFELFGQSIQGDGEFSPSDFETFGFNSLQAMRPHISQLEKIGLICSTIDDTDKRRKTIQVTPEGWLFTYGLKVKYGEDWYKSLIKSRNSLS